MTDMRCVHSEATWWPLHGTLIKVSIFWFLLSGFPCSADEHWRRWGGSSKDSYCGIYCLYASAKILGKDVDSRELIDPNYIGSPAGSSLAELKKAAEDHGLYAVAIKNLTIRELRACPYPVILHVKSDLSSSQYAHYILFRGYSQGLATVWNPPQSPERIDLINLAIGWDGTGLIISAEPIDLGTILAPVRKRLIIYAAIAISVILGVRWGRRRWLASAGKMTPRRLLRLSIAQGVGFTIAALLFGMLCHFANDEGFLANPNATASVEQAHLGNFIPKVSKKKVDRLLNANTIFIDARSPDDFKVGHLEAAINIPVNASDEECQKTMADFPKDTPIVVYSQSAGCPFAENVAIKLRLDGFTKISIFKGGWHEWKADSGK